MCLTTLHKAARWLLYLPVIPHGNTADFENGRPEYCRIKEVEDVPDCTVYWLNGNQL